MPKMKAKPTLKDLGKAPKHRTYASRLAPKVPTRLTVGPGSGDLRAKPTDRKLTIWASRNTQGYCCYPEAPAAPANIPQRLASKTLEAASRALHRHNFGFSRIPVAFHFDLRLSRYRSGRDCFRFRE
jgi:hypothetical protein